MSTPCTRDKEIATLYKVLIDGNGQPSVVQQLTTLNTNMVTYMQRQEDLIREFGITSREFYEFRTTVVTTDKERERARGDRTARSRWVVGICAIVLCAFLGVLSAWALEAKKEAKSAMKTATDLIPVNPRGGAPTPAKDKVNQPNKK